MRKFNKKYFAAPANCRVQLLWAKVITDEKFPKLEPFDAELAKFRVPARVSVPRTPAQPIFLAIAVIGTVFFLMFVISFLLSKH